MGPIKMRGLIYKEDRNKRGMNRSVVQAPRGLRNAPLESCCGPAAARLAKRNMKLKGSISVACPRRNVLVDQDSITALSSSHLLTSFLLTNFMTLVLSSGVRSRYRRII